MFGKRNNAMVCNRMTINAKKTDAMIIQKNTFVRPLKPIEIVSNTVICSVYMITRFYFSRFHGKHCRDGMKFDALFEKHLALFLKRVMVLGLKACAVTSISSRQGGISRHAETG